MRSERLQIWIKSFEQEIGKLVGVNLFEVHLSEGQSTMGSTRKTNEVLVPHSRSR